MNKISIIIKREYLSRVKKKSFLLTTFIVPLLFIGMYVAMIFLTKQSFEDTHATIYIYDDTEIVADKLQNSKNITYITSPVKSLKEQIQDFQTEKGNSNILIITDDFFETKKSDLLSAGKPNVSIQSEVRRSLGKIVRQQEYQKLGLDPALIENIDSDVQLSAKEVIEDGETRDSHTEIVMGLGITLSVLVYITLMLYGSQVMRGVIEEKTNRIVEVIISSVKPFELMMGKIVGVGLVGLTQFALWILLSGVLITVASTLFINSNNIDPELLNATSSINTEQIAAVNGMNLTSIFSAIDFPLIITCFVLFFLGGFLLYSAIFAAVGSAVDSETEASQFTMPVTMPLLITYILSFGVLINDPDGSIAVWLSMIPFTSPIAMMVRIPFGVPIWQIALSLSLLVVSFIFITWLAGRIYRVGILMYGKKASLKELIKWLKY